MKRIVYVTFICVCTLAVSCGDDNIDTTLDRVESIVVRQPDSALMLLYSLKNPYNLNEINLIYGKS